MVLTDPFECNTIVWFDEVDILTISLLIRYWDLVNKVGVDEIPS